MIDSWTAVARPGLAAPSSIVALAELVSKGYQVIKY
jgi:hypothetical protein